MKYKLHIPFVNREDLLRDAVESVRSIGNIHIWADGVLAPDIKNVTLHELPSMPFTAVMNALIQASWYDDIMFFMHNDGLAVNGVGTNLVKHAEELIASGNKWGAIFTCYDVLCCFNMEAVRDVGCWDVMFFQYTSDTDYYHRLKSGGWPIIQALGSDVIHQNDASNTNKADPIYNHRVQWRERTGFDKQYYQMKWGGMPGEEKFKRPFEDVRQ